MEVLNHVTHVSGWAPAVYMSYMSENFRLSRLSNVFDLYFVFILLM